MGMGAIGAGAPNVASGIPADGLLGLWTDRSMCDRPFHLGGS